jgi:hypothetical protein
MSTLKTSLDDSGQSNHAQLVAATNRLKEAASILDGTDLLAIRARLQEVIDALEERIPDASADAP